jgi:modulator of FtsH protease
MNQLMGVQSYHQFGHFLNPEEINTMSMMDKTITGSGQSALSTNKVLRNTYTLLSMTLLFSALCAGIAVVMNMPPMGIIITLVGYFGLLFLTTKLRNSAWGLVSVFALTGFMGLTLGPIISMYLSIPNGEQIVMTAMGGTGVIFLGLSGYALTTRKDFSFLGGFLMVGILVAFLAGIASMFLSMPGLSLAVSAMFILLMSGLILYQTSQIIHGGETNYIMATVTLYISIYNLFLSLLQLLGAFGSND